MRLGLAFSSFISLFLLLLLLLLRLSRIRPLGLFRFRIYFLKLMNLLDSWRLLGRGTGLTQGLYLHTG